jgi:hypothetical protein
MPIEQANRAGKAKRYFAIPMVVGAAERRKALYGAIEMDFEANRVTTRDADLVVSEVTAAMANRIIKPELERIKWDIVDRLVWELRPVIKVAWNAAGGVLVRRPKLVNEARTMLPGGDGYVENLPVDSNVWHKRSTTGALEYDELGATGAPVFGALGPIEFFCDPQAGSAGVARARYAGDTRSIDAGELYERFTSPLALPGNSERLDKWNGWSKRLCASSYEEEILTARGWSVTASLDTRGIITDIYYRPSVGAGLPFGFHAVLLTELPITSGSPSGGKGGLVLVWERLRFPYPLGYIDDAIEVGDARQFYGDSYVRLTSGINRGINFLLSNAVAASDAANKPRVAVTGSAIEKGDVSMLDTEMADVLLANGQDIKVSSLDTQLAGSLLGTSLVGSLIEAASLVTNSAPGSIPSQELATVARRGLLYEASVANVVKERLGRALTRSCLLGLSELQSRCSVADMVELTPEIDEGEIMLFKDSNLLTGTTIALRRSVFFAGNVEARIAFLNAIAQAKELASEHMDADQLSELMNYRDALGPTARDRIVERAEAENSMLLRGPIRNVARNKEGKLVEVVLPNSGVIDSDNDDIHIPIHQRPLDDPKRELLSPAYRRRLLEHLHAHYIKKQRAQDAANAQRMAMEQAMRGGLPQQGAPGGEMPQQGVGPQGEPAASGPAYDVEEEIADSAMRRLREAEVTAANSAEGGGEPAAAPPTEEPVAGAQ